MSEKVMPDRLWAGFDYPVGYGAETFTNKLNMWDETPCQGDTEYVRTDLYDTVTAERDAALARAERAEKALDQAIRRANLYAENELEDSDLRAAKHEVNQKLVVWNSRDDYKDLNAYLRARENQ